MTGNPQQPRNPNRGPRNPRTVDQYIDELINDDDQRRAELDLIKEGLRIAHQNNLPQQEVQLLINDAEIRQQITENEAATLSAIITRLFRNQANQRGQQNPNNPNQGPQQPRTPYVYLNELIGQNPQRRADLELVRDGLQMAFNTNLPQDQFQIIIDDAASNNYITEDEADTLTAIITRHFRNQANQRGQQAPPPPPPPPAGGPQNPNNPPAPDNRNYAHQPANPDEEDREGANDNQPAAPQNPEQQNVQQQLTAIQQEMAALREQLQNILARQGQAEPAAPGAAAPAEAPAAVEAQAGAAQAQAPDDFQQRIDQLQQNLNAIPDVPAAPDQPAERQAAAVLRDAPVEPLPDLPAEPAVRDEWPNWPEVQQAPPHPEYLSFLQQLLCQLQGQGINLQPDPRLQNAINRMLHARDAHLAGLRGWDTAHSSYAAAGLQGHDRVAAGNAFLMRQNYWGAFEQAMDGFKVELFRYLLEYKRNAFGPQGGEQLRAWARQEGRQIAINCIFPVALTMYEDMERRAAMSLQETRDRNIFQRFGDWWNRQPRWGRILMGAGIAAGIGGLVGAFVGPGLALSYAAFRGGRALAGGALAFGLQYAVDSWFVSPHYQRLRQRTSEAGQTTATGNINRLASGWEAQGLDWYARYGNLSELMRTIDRDALLHLQELNRIAQREGRTRLVTGLLTGLAGGFAGGALYDQWAHPAGAIAAVPPGGPKAPLPPEQPSGDVIRTIKPGDNLWKVSRGLIADGTITKDQWSDAWQHSKSQVLSHGVDKTVPFNTIGLVHPNDQFIIHHTPDGHVRFDVADYAKDRLHLGDNAEYARILTEHGKPLPAWLKGALHISDTTPSAKGAGASLAHAAAGVDTHGGGHAGAGPDNIINFPRTSGAELIVIDNPTPLLKSFPNEAIADQKVILGQLNHQIADLRTELKDPNLSPAFQTHDQELLTKALTLQHDLQGMHSASIEGFHTALTTELVTKRHIPWKFYENVDGMRVGDYLSAAEQMHKTGGMVMSGSKVAIPATLLDNKDAAFAFEQFLKEFSPGRFEKKMTIDAFLKLVPPSHSYGVAA